MILEKTKRLKVVNAEDFSFSADPCFAFEDGHYKGDRGRVYELSMDIGERPVRILLFDTEHGRENLLCGRFIYGKSARSVYYNCCATVAKVLLRYFPDILGYIEKAREHQILRAGRVMTLAPFIEGLKTQGDDFKRKPTSDMKMFKADASTPIEWGPETTRIFSDICPASGSTMEAFVDKVLAETKLEKLIFNCSTSTINALYRVIPLIPDHVDVSVIYWEALFSVWREDIVLPGGEEISAGTVINLNPDPDFPHYNPIAPAEVTDYLHRLFQRDRISLMPDIPGEVGEKIQDSWVGPLTYDFLELINAGMDLREEPWRSLGEKAWNMPGVQDNIKNKSPEVFEKLFHLFRSMKTEDRPAAVV